jgi:hypothetical protein
MKNKTTTLDKYRVYYIHRPHLPHILKFIDREFEVIYINLDAAPGAKVVGLK